MQYKIEIADKAGIFDAVGEGILKDILDLGINSVKKVKFIQVYTIEGDISDIQVEKICRELLTDRISQEYLVDGSESKSAQPEGQFIIEVAYNPGVMDPVEDSTLKGIRDLGIESALSIKTAKKYIIQGKLSPSELKTISDKLLYNKLIQHIVQPGQDLKHAEASYEFRLVTVDLLSADDKKLLEISSTGQLFLNINEMRAIRDYFKELKRNPTDCELETFAQTWSEHCYHKTFRGKIDYKEFTRPQVKKVARKIKSTACLNPQ